MQISKLSKIFFELSNEYRMEILNILQDKTLSLNDISLQLNLPKSEIYRNLKRLVLIGLIFMNGKNRYELSPIGKVFLLYLKNLKFLEKYHQIFKSHDISLIPKEFQLLLGDLENVEVIEGTIEGFNLTVERLKMAKSFENIMTKEILLPFTEHVKKLIEKNLRIRILAPKSIKNEFHNYLVGISNKNIKIKIVDSVNIVILGDESTAEFNLPFLNGEIDYSITFFAKNDKAVEWINGLFDYYWETLPGEIIF
ncbi:MAG: hypothetical protein QXF22_06225 [Thermoplasmata archaeon]